jgi:hypothetical protein
MECFYNIEKLIRVRISDKREVSNRFKYIPERKTLRGKIIPSHLEYDAFLEKEEYAFDEVRTDFPSHWYDPNTKSVREKYFIELFFINELKSKRHYDTREEFDDAVNVLKSTISLSGVKTITLD